MSPVAGLNCEPRDVPAAQAGEVPARRSIRAREHAEVGSGVDGGPAGADDEPMDGPALEAARPPGAPSVRTLADAVPRGAHVDDVARPRVDRERIDRRASQTDVYPRLSAVLAPKDSRPIRAEIDG